MRKAVASIVITNEQAERLRRTTRSVEDVHDMSALTPLHACARRP